MQDLVYVVVSVAFFALSWWLVQFCGRLEETAEGKGKP
jgi:hypothetical protein